MIYPNPFNPDTAIGGALKIENLIPGADFKIYTISGEFVYSKEAETVIEYWYPRNRYGSPVSAGIYYYIIKNPDDRIYKGKLFIVK